MRIEPCINKITQAAKGILSEVQLAELRAKLIDIANAADAKQSATAEEAIRRFSAATMSYLEDEMAYSQRAAVDNVRRFKAMQAQATKLASADRISRTDAVRIIMLGSPRFLEKEGGGAGPTRASVAAKKNLARRTYYGELERRLDEAKVIDKFGKPVNLKKVYKKGLYSDEVFLETANMRMSGKVGETYTGNPEAHGIAKVLFEMRQMMETREDTAGAFTRHVNNLMERTDPKTGAKSRHSRTSTFQHMHDPVKLWGANKGNKIAAFNDWVRTITPLLDETTFEFVGNRNAYLWDVFNAQISKIHGQEFTVDGPEPLSLFKRNKSLGRQIKEEAHLRFNSPESELTYFKKYLGSSSQDTFLGELTTRADNVALIESFGPDAEAVAKGLIDWASKADRDIMQDEGGISRISMQAKHARAAWRQVSGEANRPYSMGWANFVSGVNTFHVVTKLGKILLLSMPDKATMNSALTDFGVPRTRAFMASMLGGINNSKELKAFGRALGLGSDTFIGSVNSRIGIDTRENVIGYKLLQQFFRLTGSHIWNDAHKLSSGILVSNEIALHRGLKFTELPARLRMKLEMYDITPDAWNAVRGKSADVIKTVKGHEVFAADRIMNLLDNQIEPLIPKGEEFTPRTAARAKRDLADKFGMIFQDVANEAVLTPGEKEHMILTGGSAPGSTVGVLTGLFKTFKSYPVSMVTKVLNREIYGHPSNYINNLEATWRLIEFTAFSTFMGYLTYAASSLSVGRKPEELIDENGLNMKVLGKSFAYGGAGGIYADIIMTQFDRGRNNALTVLGGPNASAINSMFAHGSQAIQAPFTGGDVINKGAVLRDLESGLPLYNLFYVKLAVDQLFMFRLNEFFDPGYMLRQQQNHEFWVEPNY